MKSQLDQIFDILHREYPTKKSFTSRFISDYLSSRLHTPEVEALSNADYAYWQHNYVASLLYNATKAKTPKITRVSHKGTFFYSHS